ncbi:hypothetical protein BDW71DRAFT_216537 [Aspergillus fruticulosus]
MEHLPLPSGKKHFILAPYEAPKSDWFDSTQETFLSFPFSRHWTEAQLRGGDDATKDAHLDPNGFHRKGSPQQVEQFFQTWLFFGLAIDVLKLGDVSARVEDFLKPATGTHAKARIVDTSKLPGMLVEWEKRIKARGQLKKDWDTLDGMFVRAGSILDRFCKIPDDEDNSPLQQERPRPWPVRDEISTTMIAMACTLRRAAYNVCSEEMGHLVAGVSPWPEAAHSGILTRRLQTKWCVADVRTTLAQLPIDGHYYLAASAGLDPDELDHHAKCVRAHCRYEFDAQMYRTRHVTDDGCREDVKYGGHVGPERGQRDWVDAMTRIIDKGAIPIALWNKGMKTLWSFEYHFTGRRQPDFVAISHVWTDGKGNPHANSLPECQLDRIQRLVEGVTWEGREEVPESDYASDGVGFWMDTLCIPVEDKVRKDKAITTMRHVYSEAKAVLVLDDWLQEIRSDAPPLDLITRIYQSNWIKRLWTHQEGFLPKALWFQFKDRSVEINELSERFRAYETSLQKQGIHLGFPRSAEMRLVGQYTFLRRMFGLIGATEKWRLYFPLSAAMSERKTSRLADEVICLATIIDIPLPEFQKIPSKPDAQSGQDRMALFLKKLGKFDTGVIFNNYPRLEQRGYRWAPRSLLNFRTAEIKFAGAGQDSHFASFDPDHRSGLLVHYHGFLVNFGFAKPFAGVQRGCGIQCADSADSGQDLDEKWFLVQLPRDNSSNVEWKPWQTYAVILSEIPRPRAKAPAVVASVEERQDNGVYVVKHESIATVWVTEHLPEGVDNVRTALVRKGTAWLVG